MKNEEIINEDLKTNFKQYENPNANHILEKKIYLTMEKKGKSRIKKNKK